MIKTATSGPLWRGAGQVFSERSNFKASLQRDESLRKAPERERARVAEHLRIHKDLNRAAVRYPIENLKSAVNVTRPPSVINVFV